MVVYLGLVVSAQAYAGRRVGLSDPETLLPAVVHHEFDEVLDLGLVVSAVTVHVEDCNGSHDLAVGCLELVIYLGHDLLA